MFVRSGGGLLARFPCATALASLILARSVLGFTDVREYRGDGKPVINITSRSDPDDVADHLKGLEKGVQKEKARVEKLGGEGAAAQAEAAIEAKKAKNLTKSAREEDRMAIKAFKHKEEVKKFKKEAKKYRKQRDEVVKKAKKKIELLKTIQKRLKERPACSDVKPLCGTPSPRAPDPDEPQCAPTKKPKSGKGVKLPKTATVGPMPACPVDKDDKEHLVVLGNQDVRKFRSNATWTLRYSAMHNQEDFISFKMNGSTTQCMIRCIAMPCCVGFTKYVKSQDDRECWGFSGGQLRINQVGAVTYLNKFRLKDDTDSDRVIWHRKLDYGWSDTLALKSKPGKVGECKEMCVKIRACIGISVAGDQCHLYKDGHPVKKAHHSAYLVSKSLVSNLLYKVLPDAIKKERVILSQEKKGV